MSIHSRAGDFRTEVTLENLPVIGICGCSGSGKTTIIEALIPRFLKNGLKVAVVKDGAHRVIVDKPGKDSDRFFQAGADVFLRGEEQFNRCHPVGTDTLASFLRLLCQQYDLVLVEGHASTAIPKIWLLGEGHSSPPSGQENCLRVVSREQADVDSLYDFLRRWLRGKNLQTPVWGCILIGGKSRRMGRPKHLITAGPDRKTWLEHAVDKQMPHVEQVVISGAGDIPFSLESLVRIPDVPGLRGPMAGILAAMRWQPHVSWLVMACDLPDISSKSLNWLLGNRKPGIRAIMPDLQGDGRIEPLLAWYDFRCRNELEIISNSGSLRMSSLAGTSGVIHPQPPGNLLSSWRNVNTPDELQK